MGAEHNQRFYDHEYIGLVPHLDIVNECKSNYLNRIYNEDYLRVRNLTKWDADDKNAIITRRVCSKHNESSFYRNAIQIRTDETIANIAITLLHQEDVILRRYLDYIKDDFIKHGGIREQMARARIEYRNKK